MDFDKELNNYMKILDCTTTDICDISGISYSMVNRYINGKRTPKKDGKNYKKLVTSLYQIAKSKNVNLTMDAIDETLKRAIAGNAFQLDFDLFVDNLNKLQERLFITTVDLSRAIGYDSSFVSRIKNKERKPADIEMFIDKVGSYIALCISQSEQKKHSFINLLNCSENDLQNKEHFRNLFSEWLCSRHIESKQNEVLSFLSKLDNFNLNDYIGTDFSKVKVPTSPVIIKTSKTFLGSEGRKQAEAEFLKTTLISKAEDPIFFYSDLPMSETGQDEEFKEKWIYAMTKLLKKGLHLNIVHNLNRPINEMLLGLESWLPMYMTGSITPYYFKNPPSNFFSCSLCTSGSVALSSECLNYNEKKSMFYLTTKKDEIQFKQNQAKIMLSNATPLMDIYRNTNKETFELFISKEENKDFKKVEKSDFKNIDFYINGGKWVIINKRTSPEIHFVIHHKKLIDALKTFLLS